MAIAALSPKQSRMVVLSVMLGLFLGAMEATVVATALPTIVGKLSGLNLYSWPMAIYILASAVTGPVFGKISDLYGRKKLYLIGLAIFLAGSVLSGFSQNMVQLIIFRAIQGLGAGGVLPLSITIAGDMFSLEKRAKIQPVFSMVWGIASLVGPPLGSWLASYDWRLVFFVNIPFGLLSSFLVWTFLTETGEPPTSAQIDFLGAILLTGGILALEIALPDKGGVFFSSWHFTLFISSLVILVSFLYLEKKAVNPVLPLSLLQYPMFSSASLCQFFTGMALFGSLSFIPLYVEAVLGLGIHGTGSTLTLFLLIWVFFSFLSSRLMLKIGYRFLVISGSILLTGGFIVLWFFTETMTRRMLNLSVILLGSGMGWIMAPLIVAVQSSVPRKHLGIATSSQVLFRTIGASIGVSLMGSVMASRIQKSLAVKLHALGSSPLQESLLQIFKQPNLVLDPLQRSSLPQHLLLDASSTMSYALHGVFFTALLAAFFALMAGFLVPAGKAEKHFYQDNLESSSAKQGEL